MRILALDPATVTGWATCYLQRWHTGVINPSSRTEVDSLMEMIVLPFGVQAVVIEDCYMGANPATLKKLAVIQGRLLERLEAEEIKTLVVPATTWQAHFSITGPRVERKRGAMAVARNVLKVTGKITQDEADAACLWRYGMDLYECMPESFV